MKVLFAPFGSEGDVNPLLGMAVPLAARGHQVHFLASPFFEERIRSFGFGFTPIGTKEDYQQLAANPVLWQPVRGSALVARTMLESFPHHEAAFVSALPADLVVTSTFGLAASLGAEARGIPRIMVHMQPACLRSSRDFPLLMEGWEWATHAPAFVHRLGFGLTDVMLNATILPPINRHRRRLGLKAVKNFYHDILFSAEAICLPVPEWFVPPQADWPAPIRQMSFPRLPGDRQAALPAGVEEFLQQGEAPVVWTHGSANFATDRFQACAVEVCRRLGLRGLLVSPKAPAIPLPEGVLHVAHARFDTLFPRCQAVVHHGGIGTTAQAFAAGRPQLVIPLAHDQPDNALRVERLGVGVRLPMSRLSPERVAGKLQALIASPAVAERCAACADLMRQADADDGVVAWMEQVARDYAPASMPAAISSKA